MTLRQAFGDFGRLRPAGCAALSERYFPRLCRSMRSSRGRAIQQAGPSRPAGARKTNSSDAARLPRPPALDDLGLERRGQPLRLGEPKPQVSQAGLLVALNAG